MKPLIIRSDKGVLAGGLVAAVLVVTGGIVGFKESPVFGVCAIALFGGCLVFGPFMWRHPLILTVTDEGFSYGGSRASIFSASWSEVTGFRTGWSGLDPIDTKYNKWVFIAYRRNNEAKEYAVLPWLFGMTAEDLEAAMLSYYETAKHSQNKT